jgi:hypothetical protein
MSFDIMFMLLFTLLLFIYIFFFFFMFESDEMKQMLRAHAERLYAAESNALSASSPIITSSPLAPVDLSSTVTQRHASSIPLTTHAQALLQSSALCQPPTNSTHVSKDVRTQTLYAAPLPDTIVAPLAHRAALAATGLHSPSKVCSFMISLFVSIVL